MKRTLPPVPLSFWRDRPGAAAVMRAPVPAAAEKGVWGEAPQRVQGGARRESRGQSPLA